MQVEKNRSKSDSCTQDMEEERVLQAWNEVPEEGGEVTEEGRVSPKERKEDPQDVVQNGGGGEGSGEPRWIRL